MTLTHKQRLIDGLRKWNQRFRTESRFGGYTGEINELGGTIVDPAIPEKPNKLRVRMFDGQSRGMTEAWNTTTGVSFRHAGVPVKVELNEYDQWEIVGVISHLASELYGWRLSAFLQPEAAPELVQQPVDARNIIQLQASKSPAYALVWEVKPGFVNGYYFANNNIGIPIAHLPSSGNAVWSYVGIREQDRTLQVDVGSEKDETTISLSDIDVSGMLGSGIIPLRAAKLNSTTISLSNVETVDIRHWLTTGTNAATGFPNPVNSPFTVPAGRNMFASSHLIINSHLAVNGHLKVLD